MKIGCVLMAAGLGTRFGENKLLYEIEGRSLLARAMEAAPVCWFDRAVAVVSDDAVATLAEAAGYTVLRNPAPEQGQGGTVAFGAQAMAGMDGVLFCVADQPWLNSASVRRLLDAWASGQIAALAFDGKRGNPVLFPADCLPELAALSPEQTGRAVIARHIGRLLLVPAGNARELWDIDTREDLSR